MHAMIAPSESPLPILVHYLVHPPPSTLILCRDSEVSTGGQANARGGLEANIPLRTFRPFMGVGRTHILLLYIPIISRPVAFLLAGHAGKWRGLLAPKEAGKNGGIKEGEDYGLGRGKMVKGDGRIDSRGVWKSARRQYWGGEFNGDHPIDINVAKI